MHTNISTEDHGLKVITVGAQTTNEYYGMSKGRDPSQGYAAKGNDLLVICLYM